MKKFNKLPTLLMLATKAGCKSIVKLLIKLGSNVNSKNKDGWTALHYASCQNFGHMVKILVQHGANVNEKTNDCDLPLTLTEDLEIAQFLLDHGADIHLKNYAGECFSALHPAAYLGNTKMVQLLLKNGARINERLERNGLTALMLTALYNKLETCECLLEYGAEIDLKNIANQTALHCAAGIGSVEILKLLLKHGAYIEEKTNDCNTPLIIAALRNQTESILCLLEAGADVNAKK